MDYLAFKQSFLAHYGTKGQKWGQRNYQSYIVAPTRSGMVGTELGEAAKQRDRITESRQHSSRLYELASRKEPRITSDVSKAILSSGATMYGLENKLKTRDSLQRKILTDAVEKHLSTKQVSDKITDAVRYTSLTNNDNFVSSYLKTKAALEKKGYTEVKCKNYFEDYKAGKVKHKSVQSVFSDPLGYSFEIQFHTPESQDAKTKKIPLYEERRQLNINPQRAQQLEDAMVRLAENVPYPRNISRIKSHS